MKYTEDALQKAVSQSKSVSDVVVHFGLKKCGSANRHMRQRIDHFGIDTSHFTQKGKGKFFKPIEDIFVVNRLGRREHSHQLRREMVKDGFIELCSECGIGKTWNGKPLNLQIDHKNGNSLDNTRANLRFLCPNCHSQTDNYGSKNMSSPMD